MFISPLLQLRLHFVQWEISVSRNIPFYFIGCWLLFLNFLYLAAHVGGHKGIVSFKLECEDAFTYLLVIDGSFSSCFTTELSQSGWVLCCRDFFFSATSRSSISQSGCIKALMAMTLSLPVASLRAGKKWKCAEILYFTVSWLLHNFIRPYFGAE